MTTRRASLPYDLRLAGPALTAYLTSRGYVLGRGLSTSYDVAVAPEVCIPEGAHAEPWQTPVPDSFFGDAFFRTFRAFRSDRDALSVLADRSPADLHLYRYDVVWDERSGLGEAFDGLVRALDGEAIDEPTIPFQPVGSELLDRDGVSVTHLYDHDFTRGVTLDEARLPDIAATLGVPKPVIVEIHRAAHPYWFPTTVGDDP